MFKFAEMKTSITVMLAVATVITTAGCSSHDLPLEPKAEIEDEVDFRFEVLDHTDSFTPSLLWDVRITNTSSKPLAMWLLTIEIKTDQGREQTGTLWQENLLPPMKSYVAESLPLSVRPSCVNAGRQCAITSTAGEKLTSWKIVGKYAQEPT